MAEPIRLRVPASKSQTQRELVLAALADGESLLEGPLACDDSLHLRAGLAALGARIAVVRRTAQSNQASEEVGEDLHVLPGPLAAPAGPLWCGDGGTVVRFLAPLALLAEGELRLDGSARLRERPLAELLAALAALGVESRPLGAGALPVSLRRARAEPGQRVAIDVSRSSQFASALLLVAPRLARGLELELEGEPVSRPYLDLTLAAMRARGAVVDETGPHLTVAPGRYRARRVRIEGDWSSAAFLLAAGFILQREVVLENVELASRQGDRAILEHLAELARPRPHRLDLTACPDLIAPLAAAAAFASHETELAGVAHARLKESDRLAVLAAGLRAAGIEVEERPAALRISPLAPGGSPRPARLDPRGDHRMAMAFALLSLRQGSLELDDRACVSKSFPGFFDALARLRPGAPR
jgi:3-phosphoshikimate 1-carboxyvinyltransferase